MSLMRQEIDAIPQALVALLDGAGDAVGAAAHACRAHDPALLATVARGSSDHAASLIGHAAGMLLGLPVASVPPSTASVYGRSLRLDRAACLAVSQSGASPDIVAATRMARQAGAACVAITNTAGSDLADAAGTAVDIRAGTERSVAATKTFVSSAAAGLWVIAEWAGDDALRDALRQLPDQLRAALALDWSPVNAVLQDAPAAFVLGRGPTLGIAAEAALKLQETCGLAAQAHSAAEVRHGPMAIVGTGFPILALSVGDAAEAGMAKACDALAAMGAQVFTTATGVQRARSLPKVRGGHPLTDALATIVPVYAMCEALARARGGDPDAPPHLRKVTQTV